MKKSKKKRSNSLSSEMMTKRLKVATPMGRIKLSPSKKPRPQKVKQLLIRRGKTKRANRNAKMTTQQLEGKQAQLI